MKGANLLPFVIILFTTGAFYGQTPANDPMWHKVWEDDFDDGGVRVDKWCTRDDRRCWNPNVPDPENRDESKSFRAWRTQNGENFEFSTAGSGTVKMVVRAQDTVISSVNHCDGVSPNFVNHLYHFTAPPKLTSETKFKYGYFEIKVRLPKPPSGKTNRGIGANFWLNWHDEILSTVSDVSEIDIVEFIHGKGNSHYASLNTHHEPPNGVRTHERDSDLSWEQFHFGHLNDGGWHKIAAAWTPNKIDFFRDDRMVYRSHHSPSAMIPQRIVVDLNVFTGSEAIDHTTLLPYHYEVDYVRVYRMNNNYCKASLSTCDIDDIYPSVYRRIDINGNCNPTVHSGDTVICRAAEGITLQSDFTVMPGATFVADISSCHQQKIENCPRSRKNCTYPNNCFSCKRCPGNPGGGGGLGTSGTGGSNKRTIH